MSTSVQPKTAGQRRQPSSGTPQADTGYLVPHWPAPWGRDADAVEQLVIEEEFAEHRVKAPNLGITG